MKDDFKKRFTFSISISLGVILAILVLNYFVGADIKRRVSVIALARADVAEKISAMKALPILREEAKRAGQYSSTLGNILPDGSGLIGVSKDIKSLAIKRGIESNFTFSQDVDGTASQPGFTGFQITASGPADQFVGFLKSLEQLDYFIDFDSVDLTNISGRFNVGMIGRIFHK